MLGIGEVGGPRRVEVIEAHGLELAPLTERFEQRRGRRRGPVDEDSLVARHADERVFGRDSAALPARVEDHQDTRFSAQTEARAMIVCWGLTPIVVGMADASTT